MPRIVQFSHCGLASELWEIAADIARDSDSAEDAWKYVDKMDEYAREQIYEYGSFSEYEIDDA